ncbi:hypothetical protein FOA52_008098 [Chlamydomonas sp. UWO 241]|nr:hypothetical protein FOA52_008098 [Chlamydomonas sp. UWO 241]
MPSMTLLERKSRVAPFKPSVPTIDARGSGEGGVATTPAGASTSAATAAAAAAQHHHRAAAPSSSTAPSATAAAEDDDEVPGFCSLADVHYRDDAPLRTACATGDASTVRALLAAGANAHARDGAPLAIAAGGGHSEVVRLLIEEADVDVCAGADKALHAAVASTQQGALATLSLLLSSGAAVGASDNFALRWACLHNRLHVARALIDAGADVHAAREDALYQSAKSGHAEIVELLLERGADAAACPDAAARAAERGHAAVAARLRHAARPRPGALLRAAASKVAKAPGKWLHALVAPSGKLFS